MARQDAVVVTRWLRFGGDAALCRCGGDALG